MWWLLSLIAGCPKIGGETEPGAAQPEIPVGARVCTLLSINDTYRIDGTPDGEGGVARVRTLRARVEAEIGGPVWLLHAGDLLYPSLMSRTLYGAQMVRMLNLLDGDASAFDPHMAAVFGNHEFDKTGLSDAPKLDAQIEASGFFWLSGGVRFREGEDGARLVAADNLVDLLIRPCGSLKIGVVGATLQRQDVGYVAAFPDPTGQIRLLTGAARGNGAQVVVAVTHQSMDADQAMLEELGDSGPDLVIGGHEHNRQTRTVAGRPILKADADARTAWRVDVYRAGSGYRIERRIETLDASVQQDPQVAAAVAEELRAFDASFCGARAMQPGCLQDTVGRTAVVLEAEELKIRRFESNFGDWVADVARSAWPQAQIALINSGSLRLNVDLPPGPISRESVETMFAYPMPLRLIRLSAATLSAVLDRAITDWTGNGHWLQIAGFAFRHDTAAGTHGPPALLSAPGVAIPADKELLAVVPDFLVSGQKDKEGRPQGGDGYTMLDPGMIVDMGQADGKDRFELKEMVLTALAAEKNAAGISPMYEGRICTVGSPEVPADRPCKAP